jgi:hypothetical protein
MRTIPKEVYLRWAQVLKWAKPEHYILLLTGKLDRHRRTESILPRLVKQGRLTVDRVGYNKVYIARRQAKREHLFIEHGLGCTEILVRLMRCDANCEIIPDRFFRGSGIIPDVAVRYPNGKLLLVEFTTQDNYEHANIMKSKLSNYRSRLPALETQYESSPLVLFVIDIKRERVQNFIDRAHPGSEFFFTDYDTFKRVPIGDQLTTPIYLWGEDGKEYPLRSDHV